MKKFRWQIIIIFLTGIVVGILLLLEQPPQPDLSQSEGIQPIVGGVYTEALVGNLERLNPLLDTYNSPDRDIDRLIFSGLIKYDDRGLPEGDMAESWGVSQDGTLYNFSLKENIFWHDGQPFTANDVVFTISLLKNGGMTIPADIQSFWQDIDVTVLNERNLQFELPEPFSPFLDYLTVRILPEHLLGGLTYEEIVNSSFNLQPVGTGPYQFASLVVDRDWITGVELVANENYYDGSPYIERVVFLFYPDEASAWQAYQDGIVQGLASISLDILDEALLEPDLRLYSSRYPEFTTIFINLDQPTAPYLSDLNLRKALLMGLNRQSMVDTILGGQAVVTDSPILPGTWAYYPVADPMEYDPQTAADFLDRSGFGLAERETDNGEVDILRTKDEQFISFTLLHPDQEPYIAMAEKVRENWEALGIEVILEGLPYDILVNERLAQRDYQAALISINLARTPDPDPYPFWNQVQAVGGQNYSQWNHRMASEYLEKARVITDIGERERLYHNFQVVYQQELPSLILFYPIYTYGVSDEIQGVRVGPLFDSSDRLSTFTSWFLQAEYQ
ncbi:MAG: peptide ABC transporter substrate-binding protein [Anaerolineae bacterium]|nr:peptide ABC transporter substrate-binding protein [Anaerolineae bacterium]